MPRWRSQSPPETPCIAQHPAPRIRGAVDAAVAAAFTLAVVEPSMSGLGGRVQILIRTAQGDHVGIDGTTQAPTSYDPDTAPQASYGYDVIGIPGVPAGLLKAHGEYGTLPRSTVMAPAIQYAEDGFELLPAEPTSSGPTAPPTRRVRSSVNRIWPGRCAPSRRRGPTRSTAVPSPRPSRRTWRPMAHP